MLSMAAPSSPPAPLPLFDGGGVEVLESAQSYSGALSGESEVRVQVTLWVTPRSSVH